MEHMASFAFPALTELMKIVEKGMEHKSTAQNLETMENELRPIFEKIEEQATKMNLPAQETEHLKSVMRNFIEARIKYSKIEWWNCCLAPCYKDELDKADKSIKDFISTRFPIQIYRTVLQILENQMGTGVDADTHIWHRTFKIDVEAWIFPEFKEGLNRELMGELKSRLTTDGGDKILNLSGLTGTGKTTLALQLCLDLEVKGWFNGNVWFEPVGSKIESNGEQLASKLRVKWGERKGLLVVDNVEPGSQHFFRQCLRQLPSNSKILVISRVAILELGKRVPMEPLKPADAVTLLRYFAEPIGAASCNMPDDHILRQVAEHCGGFPIAIKRIGLDLQGKPIEFWEKHLRERQGQTIPNSRLMLLDVLHNSLQDSKEFKAISKYFLDLALFPKHEIIPVSALFDIWVELYHEVEDRIDAMIFVLRLTAMNLADRAHQMRETGSSHTRNDVDTQFLTQHYIVRELASKYSREQTGKSDMKRLIIETNRNDHPRPDQSLPQQPQRVINACFASLKTLIYQPRVAASILSITTDQNVTPEDLRFIQAAKAQVLILNLRTHEYRLPGVIKKMKNLKVLIVTNYGSQSTQLKKFKRMQFLKALKTIRLQHVTVPCVWKLKQLRKLSLYTCEVKTAFEDISMEFSKAMPNLVELRIEDSTDLEELPAGFWNIVNLKQLSITKCRNFTKLPQEIKNLGNLELLRISYCDEFKEMAESISELQSLTVLDISHCRILRKLPDNIGKLQSLTDFYMSGCVRINRLPDSVMSLKHLKRVICDEYTYDQWEVLKASLQFHLEVKPALSMP